MTLKEFNCDLHLHSPEAGGVSKNMELKVLGEQAKLKGLHCLGTGDILHEKWLTNAKKKLHEENGVFFEEESKTNFILQTEVVCNSRVHHIIFLPDFNSCDNLREKWKNFGNLDSWRCGRPFLKLSAEEIAKDVHNANGLIGPAHAFTPYFAAYAHFNSLKDLYKSEIDSIKFIELGLSADSYLADLIEENHKYQFFTFSDAHSPWPHRIGREFTQLKIRKPSFDELKKLLHQKSDRKINLNVGLNPNEGKYYKTACNNCFQQFELEQAKRFLWKCPVCKKGAIKKGVCERIKELATFEDEIHPSFRPEYLYILPLAEIVQLSLNAKNVQGKKVQELWSELVNTFKTEINVLLETPIVDISEVNSDVGKSVESFRRGFVFYYPGGGGKYGEPKICKDKLEFEQYQADYDQRKKEIPTQKNLFEY